MPRRKKEVVAESSPKLLIATRIKAFRKDQKLTQRELGERLGVNFQHISKYERGEFMPTFENLVKFNTYFNVNINWLLTGKGPMYVDQPDSYKVTGDEANQVIRDEDAMLGEIVAVLRVNQKLKLAVYEIVQTYISANKATDHAKEVIEDLVLEKINH